MKDFCHSLMGRMKMEVVMAYYKVASHFSTGNEEILAPSVTIVGLGTDTLSCNFSREMCKF
jgi:hypothetical protein